MQEGPTPAMVSGEWTEQSAAVSNVGEDGYKKMVRDLKKLIREGDIIQAVPSQRLARKTPAHPFQVCSICILVCPVLLH